MMLESLAIIFLVIIMWYTIWRNGKIAFATTILPLIVVPFFHIIGNPLARIMDYFNVMSNLSARIGIDIIGLIIAGMLFAFFATRFSTKTTRTAYLSICAGFTVILTWVYIFDAIPH